MDKRYTVEETSGILNVSEGMLRSLIESGQITHVRYGKSIRIRESDIMAYEDSHTYKGRAPIKIMQETDPAQEIIARIMAGETA